MTLLTTEEIHIFEALREQTKDAATRQALDDLLSGRTLERLLVAIQDDLEADETRAENSTEEISPTARQWCKGKAAGLRAARHRIARDNVVTIT